MPQLTINKPFFSIGITTYNRREMLSECLQSILNQTYTDFEVVVGNDFISDKLTLEEFEIQDPRFKIVNHENNLGEINNMNWLLNNAKGRYFTWLADDDAYYPRFLESIYNALIANKKLDCIYSGYNFAHSFNGNEFNQIAEVSLMTGSDLFFRYHSKEINLHGCYGVFEVEYLKKIGGMQQTGSGLSPYSSDIIILNTLLKKQVGYQNESPIFYRNHEESLSIATTDIVSYVTAQFDFLNQLKHMLLENNIKFKNQSQLMFYLSKTLIDHFFGIKLRSKESKLPKKEYSIIDYVTSMNKYIVKISMSSLFFINMYFIKKSVVLNMRSIKRLNQFICYLKNY